MTMDKATETAVKEAKLKEKAETRTEVTEHCQEFRKNLHEVMNHNPDQPEYSNDDTTVSRRVRNLFPRCGRV